MSWLELSPEVAQAKAEGRPIIAMESSVWAQGLPHPLNLEVAREACALVRELGVVPAVTVLWEGKLRFGLSDAQLAELCDCDDTVKVGAGDIPAVLARRARGATTVSATLLAADQASIPVMATGGLGGIHLDWIRRLDISADLGQLARSRCLTVCSGVKSVLDVATTLEMLETLAIPLVLYGTDHFPRFYTLGEPAGIGVRMDTPEEVAVAHRLSLECLGRGLLVAQPCPSDHALDTGLVEQWVQEGMLMAEQEQRLGKALTPFLLDYLARESDGRTLEANRALLLQNVNLAARIARALKASERG